MSEKVHSLELGAVEKKRPSKRLLAVAAIIIVTVAAVCFRLWWRSVNFVETDNAYVTGHVHMVSSRIPGTITRVLIAENQRIRAGEIIAELDPADHRIKLEQLRAEIRWANQQLQQAEAQISLARAGADAAAAEVLQAKAKLWLADQDERRYRELHSGQVKFVSSSYLDAVYAKRAEATANVDARVGSVTAAQAQIAEAQAARNALKARVAVLDMQVKEAEQQLSYNRIIAPVDGRIGKRTAEVGMRVQPGQGLMAIVQDEVWISANFKETQVSRLREGQHARVRVDALSDRVLTARIDSFSPASGSQFALLPPDNATGNFTKVVQRVPVKLTLRPEEVGSLEGRIKPGMSVLVEVDLRDSI